MPDFEIFSWVGFMAPAGTPRAIVDKLNIAINRAVQEPDFRSWVESLGSELMVGTPEQFGDYMKLETDRWGRMIRNAKVEPE